MCEDIYLQHCAFVFSSYLMMAELQTTDFFSQCVMQHACNKIFLVLYQSQPSLEGLADITKYIL